MFHDMHTMLAVIRCVHGKMVLHVQLHYVQLKPSLLQVLQWQVAKDTLLLAGTS